MPNGAQKPKVEKPISAVHQEHSHQKLRFWIVGILGKQCSAMLRFSLFVSATLELSSDVCQNQTTESIRKNNRFVLSSFFSFYTVVRITQPKTLKEHYCFASFITEQTQRATVSWDNFRKAFFVQLQGAKKKMNTFFFLQKGIKDASWFYTFARNHKSRKVNPKRIKTVFVSLLRFRFKTKAAHKKEFPCWDFGKVMFAN